MSLSVFPPQNPPIVPSSQNVLEGAVACTSNILLSIPFFVEVSAAPVSIALLDSMAAVEPKCRKCGTA